ncbi:L-threonylcarbamoyladenylate synthase [Candidatus Nitrosacidococcus sp. I8]|uniref:L-threonylcarbamoyladenylate synthase n=1 Tax=Candidatus Nitrosacidococcus sp. I8 TaxID=2942908 RepID=UPI00222613F3|nr:L-threonylcarbamoyladenylate synthase [Candidatus Nitrosacidococcus sp. I8]CAH9015787.1 Threonylcarbamoyl-AMP synthase [Candidatus Nitrosacidococcus sp. I8]
MAAALNIPIRVAASTIRNGGVIAYPTESVFGLGCEPLNKKAVDRILHIKDRPKTKGLIVIAANFSQLQPYLLPLPNEIKDRLVKTWPGPTTWLLPAKPSIPSWLRGKHNTLAVRVTNHPLVIALCETVNSAIISTSANRTRQPPARTTFQVYKCFHKQVDFILKGETSGRVNPSDIFDGKTGKQIR